MTIQLNIRHIYLAILLVFLTNLPAHAGFFDDALQKTKNTVTNVIDKTVEKKANEVADQVTETEPGPEPIPASAPPTEEEKPKATPKSKTVATSQPQTKSEQSTAKTVQSGERDIVGLKLGMGYEQAVEAITTHNGNLSIKKVMHSEYLNNNPKLKDREYIEYIHATDSSSQENIFLTFAEPPATNVVQAISRRVLFKEPLLENQINYSLISKYGKPTEQGSGGFAWVFNGNKDITTLLTCRTTIDYATMQAHGQGADAPLIREGNKSCNDFLVVGTGATEGLVHEMSATLVNLNQVELNREATFRLRDRLMEDMKQAELDKKKEEASHRSAPKF